MEYRYNSEKEFACGIINHGKLYDQFGLCYGFAFIKGSDDYMVARFFIDGAVMCASWENWKEGVFTTTPPIPPLKDKQPVMAWDVATHSKQYCFYDAKNDCIFSIFGKRGGISYNNIKPIPPDEVPQWMWDAQRTLED